ncbi:MAG: glycosyltransferase family 4 protein [Rhodospirillales bacterium]
MKKRILFVAYTFPPFGGGGEPVALNVLNFLKDNERLELDVLTSWDIRSKKRPDTVEKVGFHIVPVWRKSMTDTGLLGMFMFIALGAWKIRKLLKENNYDLVHYWTSIPSGLLSFLHRGRIPYIVSLYGGDIPKFVPGELQFFHRLAGPFNKSVVRNAITVTAMSNAAGQAAEKELGPANMTVIWNATEAPSIDSQAAAKRDDGVLRLISVGRMLDWKRFDMVIKAVGKCDDVELVVVGDGPEKGNLERLANKNCAGKARFLGLVNKDRVYGELSKSDVFVLPSIADSFGNVYVEAMACGLPVVGARAGGVVDIIEDGVNGFLIEPDNLDELVGRINFLKDPGKREKMARESIRIFQEKFTWPRVFEKYREVYRELGIGWD